MATEHDNGGWALPQPGGGGMTMLEWYAGQVLAGGWTPANFKQGHELTEQKLAKTCFDVAEAMIAEHKRRTA